MKKQKENSHEGITWSEMGKQNVQAEKVYWPDMAPVAEEVRLLRFQPKTGGNRGWNSQPAVVTLKQFKKEKGDCGEGFPASDG